MYQVNEDILLSYYHFLFSFQQFYLILNVAIGGKLGYFPDDVPNEGHKKPWENDSPRATDEFWAAKDDWYPTWIDEDAALQVKSVKIWEKED